MDDVRRPGLIRRQLSIACLATATATLSLAIGNRAVWMTLLPALLAAVLIALRPGTGVEIIERIAPRHRSDGSRRLPGPMRWPHTTAGVRARVFALPLGERAPPRALCRA